MFDKLAYADKETRRNSSASCLMRTYKKPVV